MFEPLTRREKRLARRNYILFCGIATIFMVLFVAGAAILINE